jgi:hypothetical protein
MNGLKTFFKERKNISLKGVSPSNDAFLLAQDSEYYIFPPSHEDNEALAMLRGSCRGMYDEATDLGGIGLAEDVKAKCLLLENEANSKKSEFSNFQRCIMTAEGSRRRGGRPGRSCSRPRSGRRAGAGADVHHVEGCPDGGGSAHLGVVVV